MALSPLCLILELITSSFDACWLVFAQDGKDKENWLKFYVNPYSGMAEAELTEPVGLNQANLEVSQL